LRWTRNFPQKSSPRYANPATIAAGSRSLPALIQMKYRTKLGLAIIGSIAFLFIADTIYEAAKTIRQLDVIEAERDQWQRPADIIDALDLKPGDSVVDLGCGSGYFSLKLSSTVGAAGKVYAVEIRRLPLMFLWARAGRREHYNIARVLAKPDNPAIQPSTAQAVLIANTFHELDDSDNILDHLAKALVPGGRLVIVDPMRTESGVLTVSSVEGQLRRHGFDIVSSDNGFINKSPRGVWWLIVAKK
jgi:SAM-dependent methyltransferase